MNEVLHKTRQTKYCLQIEEIVTRLGHASNAEILAELHTLYPTVSATTVHRATARLAGRSELGVAPADQTGAMRYDANPSPHDHFMCTHCGMLRDVDIAEYVKPLLEEAIEGCSISGRITIGGTCKQCSAEGMT
jgi:Fur family transcriptional regulator, peroxide stress response regulator